MAFVARPFDPFCRVTIDSGIRYRRSNFALNELGGDPLLLDGISILEIKVGESVPLWLAHLTNRYRIFRIPFSKYGTTYLKADPQESKTLLLTRMLSNGE